MVGATALGKGAPLDLRLKVHAVEGMAAVEILAQNVDDHRRVGKAAVAGVIAHAVDREVPSLGAGRQKVAAGAHAESPNPALGGVRRELVFRGWQQLAAAELDLVDLGLRMLKTRAHGEGLRRYGQA